MKRKIILLLIFLIVINFASAAKEKIVRDDFLNGESILANGKVFTVYLSEDNSEMLVLLEAFPYVIEKGSCEDIEDVEICLRDVGYDNDHREFNMDVEVYSLSPDITIIREFSNTSVNIGDEIDVVTTIANSGEQTAQDFYFEDDFGDAFEVVDAYAPLQYEKGVVFWNGFLKTDKPREFKYTIKAVKKADKSYRAKATFVESNQKKKIYSSAIRLTTEPFLNINMNFAPEEISLGENTTVIISIENLKDEDISLDYLDIIVPEGLKFIKTDTISVKRNASSNKNVGRVSLKDMGDNVYRYSRSIKANSVLTDDADNRTYVVMKFQKTLSGKSTVILRASYSYDDLVFRDEIKSSIGAELKGLSLVANFDDEDEFDSSEPYYLRVGVLNSNNNVRLKYIRAKINSNIAKFKDSYIKDVSDSKSRYIINGEYVMPEVTGTTTFPIDIILKAETNFGEIIEENETYNLVVKPIESLDISHDFDKSSVEGGGEFIVTTKIKNSRAADVYNVRVFDDFSTDFENIKGITSRAVDIPNGKEIEAYTYTLKAPFVKKQKAYFIESNARYDENGKTYESIKKDIIAVNPKSFDATMTQTLPSGTTVGELADVKLTITNNEDEEAMKNIMLKFPISEDADVIGNRTYDVGSLEAGESITLDDAYVVRFKHNGTHTLKKPEIIFTDEEGHNMNISGTAQSVDIDSGALTGPAFIIDAQIKNNTIFENESADIVITTTNIGRKKGKIEIFYDNNRFVWNIPEGETRRNNIRIKAGAVGAHLLEPIEGSYEVSGFEAATSSGRLRYNVIKRPEIISRIVKKIRNGTKINESAIKTKAESIPIEDNTIIGKIKSMARIVMSIFKR